MATEMNVLHGLVHTRITNLLAARRLFRRNPQWSMQRHSVEIELRALLALARQARRTAQAETVWHVAYHDGLEPPEFADPVTAAKSYHDLQAR